MPFDDYLALLAHGGTLVQVGVPEAPISLKPFSLIVGRKSVTGSCIGSPDEIREMFQLAADKHIKPWVEKRPMKDANQTLIDLEAGKPRFRYVLVNES
jgi:D-arabinose 1-dehydrogenase-like Zn-dependent alcohol dehydrogenase